VEEQIKLLPLVVKSHNGKTSGKVIKWGPIASELGRDQDAVKQYWTGLKSINKDLIDWTSKEAIQGLTHGQLKWRGKPHKNQSYKPNNNVEAKKRLKKTITYKLSKKPAFPYPGLSYEQHVKRMEDSWLEMYVSV
jgi:hypothetical protein